MLLICTLDKSYTSELLNHFTYKKVSGPLFCEIYECNYNEHEFIIATLGYGKVSCASNLRFICDNYNIGVVLNYGTAGSVHKNASIFTAVIADASLQFDVDFTPLKYNASVIPNLPSGIYKTNDDINDCLKRASVLCNLNYLIDIISSSDMFVNNYNLSNSIKMGFNSSVMDLDSGTIGEYCYINHIAYSSIKVISYFCNNNSVRQYNLYNNEASIICQKIVYKFIKDFYN